MKRLSAVLAIALTWSCGGSPPAEEAPADPTADAAMAVPGCFVRGEPAALAERASPLDSVMIPLGDAEAKLCYGRPSARGRTMVGGQDPFGAPWRMGANEATHLHLPVAASVGDVDLEPGSYTLYAIPTEEDWTIVVNSAIERWGIPISDEVRSADVGRFTVTPTPLPEPVETLEFSWDDVSNSLVYAWEQRTFRIPVTPR